MAAKRQWSNLSGRTRGLLIAAAVIDAGVRLNHTAKRGMETATTQLDTRIRLRTAERLVERQGSGDALELDRS